MLPPLTIPPARPPRAAPGYNLPAGIDHLLPWSFVEEHMTAARYYWIGTVSASLRPHAVPVWGIWHDNRIHVDGGAGAAWVRNIAQNAEVAVHLPDANQVVIIEGHAQMIESADEESWQIIDSLYQQKYNVAQGSPYIVVHPRTVLAWDNASLQSMTRWLFR